jgi:hypothetical protein
MMGADARSSQHKRESSSLLFGTQRPVTLTDDVEAKVASQLRNPANGTRQFDGSGHAPGAGERLVHAVSRHRK